MYLLCFHNVVVRGKSEEEKALDLIADLDGDAFEFFFENFLKDGKFLEEA